MKGTNKWTSLNSNKPSSTVKSPITDHMSKTAPFVKTVTEKHFASDSSKLEYIL